MAGDIEWAPYLMEDLGEINPEESYIGVAPYVLRKIFSELDLPFEIRKISSKWELTGLIQRGDIDILAATYSATEIDKIADPLTPGFVDDPLMIAVLRGGDLEKNTTEWLHLIGQRGLKSFELDFNLEFQEFVERYLYIEAIEKISDALDMIANRKADYILGSKLQLSYYIQQLNLENKLKILNTPVTKNQVYMAFAKKSECRAYIPYVKSRLQELKDSGEIDKELYKYIQIKN